MKQLLNLSEEDLFHNCGKNTRAAMTVNADSIWKHATSLSYLVSVSGEKGELSLWLMPFRTVPVETRLRDTQCLF